MTDKEIIEAQLVIMQIQRDQLGALHMIIDSLMLEYCPDEMTPEQVKTWGENQKEVKP